MSATGTTAPVSGVDIDLPDDAASRPPLTAERLRELLDYDPKTGRMTWRVTRAKHAPAGSAAGHLHSNGYVYVSVDGRTYKRSRLAYLYVKGVWPKREVDHKNGVKDDDRMANLRDVSRSENSRNTRPWGRSGVKGVCFDARRRLRPWRAKIYSRGKTTYLGNFATKAEASAAYTAAANRLHGRFAASRRRGEGRLYLSVSDARLGERLAELVVIEMEAEAAQSTTEVP